MTEDLHSPASAGPEPTRVVGASEATTNRPAGSAASSDGSGLQMPEMPEIVSERPEILVGAAFAGGFLAALILKRLGR